MSVCLLNNIDKIYRGGFWNVIEGSTICCQNKISNFHNNGEETWKCEYYLGWSWLYRYLCSTTHFVDIDGSFILGIMGKHGNDVYLFIDIYSILNHFSFRSINEIDY